MGLSISKMKACHNIVLVGNTEFGFQQLKSLIKNKHNVAAVFTSTMSTRGFERLCKENKIDLFRIENINNNINLIRRYNPKFVFALGWSQMFKKEMIKTFNCIGMHPALLPRRRGRAPITWAILDNLGETGVTLFYLDEGVDSGDIIAQETIKIRKNATSLWLIKAANKVLSKMVDSFLTNYPHTPKIKQDHGMASYTPKRTPDDGEITLDMNGEEWGRYLRALTPPIYPPPFIKNKFGDRLYILKGKIEKRGKV